MDQKQCCVSESFFLWKAMLIGGHYKIQKVDINYGIEIYSSNFYSKSTLDGNVVLVG